VIVRRHKGKRKRKKEEEIDIHSQFDQASPDQEDLHVPIQRTAPLPQSLLSFPPINAPIIGVPTEIISKMVIRLEFKVIISRGLCWKKTWV
jgi:hypothetical protein